MRNKFLGFISLLYAGIIIYVWVSDSLKNYLAPNMYIYIKSASVLLIILGLFLLFTKEKEKFRVSDIILLLPLVLLILSGDARLNVSFANNRTNKYRNNQNKVETTTTTTKEQGEKVEVFTTTKPVEVKKEDIKIDFEVKDSVYSGLANYITFPSNASISSLENKTIKLRGFALTTMEILSSDYFAIGKYEISCCAADAEFAGFIAKKNDINIENGKWYEIIGTLKLGQDKQGYDIMYIEIIDIKSINEKEENQNVYPCYTYDDGTCKDLQKYGLVN